MLVLRNFVEPQVLETWRAQFWAHHRESYGALEQDPETWLRVGQQEQDLFLPMRPEFGQLPQVRSVVAQLGGANFKPATRANENQSMTVVTMPNGPTTTSTLNPHLD